MWFSRLHSARSGLPLHAPPGKKKTPKVSFSLHCTTHLSFEQSGAFLPSYLPPLPSFSFFHTAYAEYTTLWNTFSPIAVLSVSIRKYSTDLTDKQRMKIIMHKLVCLYFMFLSIYSCLNQHQFLFRI